MICVGLVVVYCFTAKPSPVDSYCDLYKPVVVDKGDGVIQATLGVKKRLLANEQLYRKVCNGNGAKGN